MPLEIFHSATNRRASASPMVTISARGVLKFNVGATRIIKDSTAKKLLLLWDSAKRRIGIASAKPSDECSYTITHNKAKGVCQIVVRGFPRHIGMKSAKAFRVAMKASGSSDLVLEGIIPAEYIFTH